MLVFLQSERITVLKLGQFTSLERQLGRRARQIAAGKQVLYHGTRHVSQVLKTGKLLPSIFDETVAFSRSPEVAAYFALLSGRKIDGYSGAVLVLNKDSLRQRYRIETFHDAFWNDEETYRIDEQEENVFSRTINFRRHLIGVIRAADLHVTPGINPVTGTADTPGDAVKKAQRSEVLAFRVPADSLLFSEEYGLAGGGWD